MDTNTEPHYSEFEVQVILDSLEDTDIARLLQIYNTLGCAVRAGFSNHEVLSHAVGQALSRERLWPRDLNVVSYLKQSGRSIISNEADKRSKLIITPTIDELTTTEDISSAVAMLSHPASETCIEQAQSNKVVMEWIAKIRQLFQDDQDASCFIKQKLETQKKALILILCKFSDQVYRNVEKRIKDKVKKRFPSGLPWWEI